MVVFADDTNAILGANDIELLNKNVNSALDFFKSWFSANKLEVNVKKTNIILFKSTARQKDNLKVLMNGEHIALVENVKFLGVCVDSLLNWKSELLALESSVSSSCYALRSLRDILNTDELKMVYHALIESKFRYSIQFWGQSYEYNINKAFILQKRSIRTILRISQNDSCRDHFKNLGILTVPSLYILVVLNFLVKYIYDFETDYERRDRESTRRKNLRHKIQPTLNITKQCTLYQSVEIFNRLPHQIKELLYRPNLFKQKVKAFLLDKIFYSINDYL